MSRILETTANLTPDAYPVEWADAMLASPHGTVLVAEVTGVAVWASVSRGSTRSRCARATPPGMTSSSATNRRGATPRGSSGSRTSGSAARGSTCSRTPTAIRRRRTPSTSFLRSPRSRGCELSIGWYVAYHVASALLVARAAAIGGARR